MAKKYTLKDYKNNQYYHIYNCGIDKKTIFADDEDYQHFLNYLEFYLAPFKDSTPEGFKKDRPSIVAHKQAMNLAGQVTLVAFCLMPDHFHLVLYQSQAGAIAAMVRRVGIQYAMYFNKKYERRGPLYEGVYKAVEIKDSDQLAYVCNYIHQKPIQREIYKIGPVQMRTTSNPVKYPYSSLRFYKGELKPKWLNLVSANRNNDVLAIQSIYENLTISTNVYPKLLLDI